MEGGRRVHPVLQGLVGMGVLGALAAGGLIFLRAAADRRVPMERNAAASLKTIASAQHDYRHNDRDGNRRADYWRSDVAGLYTLVPPGSAEPIRLIEQAVAAADAVPAANIPPFTSAASKAGYRFKALLFAGEDAAKPDPDRFAACAFPDGAGPARKVLLISHDLRIYVRDWNGPTDTPLVFPADPLREGWERFD